jgi:hypothetical protein
MYEKPNGPHDPITPMKPPRKVERFGLPLLRGKGRPGPRCPRTKTPYDLIFADRNT